MKKWKSLFLSTMIPFFLINAVFTFGAKIQESEEDIYLPKVSFRTISEAKEFIQFAPSPNLIIVKTRELKNYYLGLEYKRFNHTSKGTV